jgi:hypothetical protein
MRYYDGYWVCPNCKSVLLEGTIHLCSPPFNTHHLTPSTMNAENKIRTIGEQRVRTDFNVGQDDTVARIKLKTAELINLCEELKSKDPRLASIAQTEYESAAHWAVKAATT